ncbi:unnamed protein product [Soboliphyme baturini]|uniref:Salivary lipocalin n=1 Tax=Soboliphyme baturini TaxID=241478 RepID=A0A183J0B3_9BILA|nr:unnamed protein product [Soboliphyme baturini]
MILWVSTMVVLLTTLYLELIGSVTDRSGIVALHTCSVETNITVVTAFIDIGTFIKGTTIRTTQDYTSWFYSWGKLLQPVVFYYNKRWIYEQFRQVRGDLPTKYMFVNLFNESEGRSWMILKTARKIFAQKGYPKHHPPTTNPPYVVIMHAKYDMLEEAVDSDYFKTECTMWLDLGLFREYKSSSCFVLKHPPNFDPSKIAFNKVHELKTNKSSEWIIKNMPHWVCGGTILGKNHIIKKFVHQYRRTTDSLLARNLIGDDQMTIYSMFSDATLNTDLNVKIQTYEGRVRESPDPWFYLGYLMKHSKMCG